MLLQIDELHSSVSMIKPNYNFHSTQHQQLRWSVRWHHQVQFILYVHYSIAAISQNFFQVTEYIAAWQSTHLLLVFLLRSLKTTSPFSLKGNLI